MSKRAEHKLITENFRKWLAEEYTPPMEEASTFEKWLSQDKKSGYKKPTEQERIAKIERERDQERQHDASFDSARATERESDRFNRIIGNHIQWLDNKLHELDPDTYDRPSGSGELPDDSRDQELLNRIQNYGSKTQQSNFRHYRGEVEEKEGIIRKINRKKKERTKQTAKDAEAGTLKGKFKKGVGKVKDFAGDIKDKFFEEHGDKYSGSREMIEEIIDKALANIDKK